MCAGLDTASVRMPSHPVALAVIRAAGVPLAAPSANLSGSPSPTTAADVLADMEGKIPLILDGGACSVGVESTVISLAGAQPVLLRPGYITKEQLEDAMGCAVALSDAVLHKLKDGERAASPGMKYKHYAPKADVTILKGSFDAYKEYMKSHCADGVYALCFTGEEPALPCPCVTYGRADQARTSRRTRCFQPCVNWMHAVQKRCLPAARRRRAWLWLSTTVCCARRRSVWWRCRL